MSTIVDNFIKDGTFGRRLLAMFASFYAIAMLYGRSAGSETRTGYATVAAALRAVGLDGVPTGSPASSCRRSAPAR